MSGNFLDTLKSYLTSAGDLIRVERAYTGSDVLCSIGMIPPYYRTPSRVNGEAPRRIFSILRVRHGGGSPR